MNIYEYLEALTEWTKDYVFSKSFMSIPNCFKIPRIVPSLRSLFPQSGTTVPLPEAGLIHFLWEPAIFRGISLQPKT